MPQAKTPKPITVTTIDALTDIVNHLDGGAPLYPGALIFEEDAPAVDVLKRLLRAIKRDHAQKEVEERTRIVAPAETFSDRLLEAFPWIGTEEEPSGADVIQAVCDLYDQLIEEGN
jgi:hypothetical protein